MPGRNRFFNDVSFVDPRVSATMPLGRHSRFPGMPVGVQLFSDWNVHYIPMRSALDFDETNDWAVTEIGAGATRAFAADLWPPHLIVTNDPLDNDSTNAQLTTAAGGESVTFIAAGFPTGYRHACYYETMIRLRDANNDEDTVEQVDWFVGLAVTDTVLLAGASDYIGFVKRDQNDEAGNPIRFSYGGNGGVAGALVENTAVTGRSVLTGWTSNNHTAVVPNTLAGHRAARVLGANEWIKLGFYAEGSDASGTNFFAIPYVNDAPVSAPILPLAGNPAGIPDTEMCLSFAIRNGEAVAKIMDVAYILLAQRYGDI